MTAKVGSYERSAKGCELIIQPIYKGLCGVCFTGWNELLFSGCIQDNSERCALIFFRRFYENFAVMVGFDNSFGKCEP